MVDLEHDNAALRAALSSITIYLDELLSTARFPGKGRSIDEKSSIMEWWDERLRAVADAKALLVKIDR